MLANQADTFLNVIGAYSESWNLQCLDLCAENSWLTVLTKARCWRDSSLGIHRVP